MSIHDEIRSGISCTYTLSFTLPDDLEEWLCQASPNALQKYGWDLDAASAVSIHGGSHTFREIWFEYHTLKEAEAARAKLLTVLGEYAARATAWRKAEYLDPQP